jgi:hypothetical protein
VVDATDMRIESESLRRGRGGRAAATVRNRVMRGGDRLWRHDDFADLPSQAVNQTLSRLARQGALTRVHKGTYYRPRKSVLGESLAPRSAVTSRALKAPLHPSGLTAANALGLSTQNPARPQYATPTSRPGTRPDAWTLTLNRPAGRRKLSQQEGAILELLRARAATSDLSVDDTIARLKDLLSDDAAYARLAKAALDEPPRVRAMLGALGQELGADEAAVRALRKSLNPVSRFDFGKLRALRFAKDWQAK